MGRILIVEDEPAIAELIALHLRHEGHEVRLATDAAEAAERVREALPDLVILDWMLPGESGVTLARRWRSDGRTKELPIIMLTARSEERDLVAGLDAGADDYLTKPFGTGELLARVRANLRRPRVAGGDETAEAVFRFGEVELDRAARIVRRAGAEVHLTPTEYRLLSVLVANAGRVLTQRQLLREVWGPSHTDQSHYLRIYMGHLRQKLEADPAQPRHLLTETAVGYRLVV